jgi:hypothetical protein
VHPTRRKIISRLPGINRREALLTRSPPTVSYLPHTRSRRIRQPRSLPPSKRIGAANVPSRDAAGARHRPRRLGFPPRRLPLLVSIQHKASYRRERMPVDRSDVDRATCAAAGAIDIKSWAAGNDGAADRARPQRGSPCRQYRNVPENLSLPFISPFAPPPIAGQYCISSETNLGRTLSCDTSGVRSHLVRITLNAA